MKKDIIKTEVIFRVDKTKEFKGEVFALMPYEITVGTNVSSYQHVGQHSPADYNHCIATSRPATASEAANLKKEMEDLGYNIKVIQKYSHAKYLIAYKHARKLVN